MNINSTINRNSSNLIGLALSLLTVISLTACNQAIQLSKSTETSKDANAEQATWLQLTNEAKAALAAGDKTTAEAKFKGAIAAAKSLSAQSPDQAAAIANLADFYYAQGDGSQACHLYSQSLAMHEKALGLMHLDLVSDLVGLAHAYTAEKRYEKAKESLVRAIDILKKSGKSTPVDIEVDLKKLDLLTEPK